MISDCFIALLLMRLIANFLIPSMKSARLFSSHFMIPMVANFLHRHNTENSKQIFPEKELRGLSPNFHIHVPVSDLYISDLYIPRTGPHIFLSRMADQSWEYIICSKTHECGNWDWGWAIPFLVTHFRCSAAIIEALRQVFSWEYGSIDKYWPMAESKLLMGSLPVPQLTGDYGFSPVIFNL